MEMEFYVWWWGLKVSQTALVYIGIRLRLQNRSQKPERDGPIRPTMECWAPVSGIRCGAKVSTEDGGWWMMIVWSREEAKPRQQEPGTDNSLGSAGSGHAQLQDRKRYFKLIRQSSRLSRSCMCQKYQAVCHAQYIDCMTRSGLASQPPQLSHSWGLFRVLSIP